MPKAKNIFVSTILVVYCGLIGANLVWQYGDQIFSTKLKTEVAGENGEMSQEERDAEIDAQLEADNSKAKTALAAQEYKQMADAATQQARAAQQEIQEAGKTVSQKATELQGAASKIALCVQKPEACIPKPVIENPKYKALLDTIEKAKALSQTITGTAAVLQEEFAAKQAEIQLMMSQLNFAQKWNLPISGDLLASVQKLQAQASEKCLSTMSSISNMDTAREAAKETAAAGKSAGIGEETTETVEDPETGATTIKIVPGEVGDPRFGEGGEAPPEIDPEKLVADAVAKEQKRQAEIKSACAKLQGVGNQITAGSKNYAALASNLSQLRIGLGSTTKNVIDALTKTKTSITQNVAQQMTTYNQSQMLNAQKMVSTQLAINKAKADAAKAEKAGPGALPIGFLNYDSEGNKLNPNYGDVIPIAPVGENALPTWDYNSGDNSNG
ncbi:MAG: hypothetical protein V2A63_03335 [Patescibacteria group bacterium]